MAIKLWKTLRGEQEWRPKETSHVQVRGCVIKMNTKYCYWAGSSRAAAASRPLATAAVARCRRRCPRERDGNKAMESVARESTMATKLWKTLRETGRCH